MKKLKLTMSEIRALNSARIFVGADPKEAYSLFDCPLAVKKEDISKLLDRILEHKEAAFNYMSAFTEHFEKFNAKLARCSLGDGKTLRLSFPIATLISFIMPLLNFEYNDEAYHNVRYSCILDEKQFEEVKKLLLEVDARNKRIKSALESATTVSDFDEEGTKKYERGRCNFRTGMFILWEKAQRSYQQN